MYALKAAVSLFALAICAGCGEPVTQIIIVADSDLPFPSQYDGVKVSAIGPEGTSEYAIERFAFDETPRPVTTTLYPLLDAYAPLHITVRAEGSPMSYPPRYIETEWLPGESLVLDVFLAASCDGVVCPENTTCIDGACASPVVDAQTLPRWDGEDPIQR